MLVRLCVGICVLGVTNNVVEVAFVIPHHVEIFGAKE